MNCSIIGVRTEIFYFTGTGNSLIIARELAKRLEATLVPIASAREVSSVLTDAELVGIVFPNYYGDIPPLVRAFAEHLVVHEKTRIFAVCTYGGGPGKTFKSLEEILEARGSSLWNTYGVHMPQNAFRKPWEKYPKIYESATKRIDKMARLIEDRRRRRPVKDILAEALFSGMTGLFEKKTRAWLAENTGSTPELPLPELIHRADRLFSLNEDCNGCGICAEVCPADNIRIERGRPVWSGKCENCLACYNWCPRRAITGGIAKEGYFYRHPDVTIADMIAQKIIR